MFTNEDCALDSELEKINANSRHIKTREALADWISSDIKSIFPHESAMVIVAKYHSLGLRIKSVLPINLPSSYIDALREDEDLNNPLLSNWLTTGQPVFFLGAGETKCGVSHFVDAAMMRHRDFQIINNRHAKWLNNFRQHNLRNAILDGFAKVESTEIMFLEIYNSPHRGPSPIWLMRSHILPSIYRAWQQILAEDKLHACKPADQLFQLTLAESELLQWIELGKTNSEMGVILKKSVFTVKTQMQSILKKVGVENRIALIAVINAANKLQQYKPQNLQRHLSD